MGGAPSRPRRGFPDVPNVLPPGVALSRARDLDVVVLRAGDVPLRLAVVTNLEDVVVDDAASTSEGVEHALVAGSDATLSDRESRVVVDVLRGRDVALRSPAARDACLAVAPLAADGSHARRSPFRFVRASDAARGGGGGGPPKAATWTWTTREAKPPAKENDADGEGAAEEKKENDANGEKTSTTPSSDVDASPAPATTTKLVCVFRNAAFPAVELTAVGPTDLSTPHAARIWTAFLDDELEARRDLKATLEALARDADAARATFGCVL